jgi:uncharacterized Zn finger protein (UPF0148 family)
MEKCGWQGSIRETLNKDGQLYCPKCEINKVVSKQNLWKR